MSPGAERRLLQAAVVLAGFVPTSAGLSGLLLGPAITDAVAPIGLDSHFRYLSGLLLALGLAFWGMVPRIERYTRPVRLLTFLVLTGGLGRLLGVLLHGIPPWPMIGGLAMELVVTPALCVWQTRVARQASVIATEATRQPA